MESSRQVHCLKLKKDAPGLATAPYPGELGEKILQHISAEAWQQWLQHQTMLINEYRLSLVEREARQFLEEEMEKFLFNQGSDKPPGYKPSDKDKQQTASSSDDIPAKENRS